jgi:hypothetical protein
VVLFVELSVLIASLLGLALGGCSIYWVKVKPCPRRACWGRRLFIATLLALGAVAFLAALMHADGLATLGLISGLLTVCMLWEGPAPLMQDD